MQRLDVRGLNDFFNVDGPDYIMVSTDDYKINVAPVSKKETNSGYIKDIKKTNIILKIEKFSGELVYERKNENEYNIKYFNKILENIEILKKNINAQSFNKNLKNEIKVLCPNEFKDESNIINERQQNLYKKLLYEYVDSLIEYYKDKQIKPKKSNKEQRKDRKIDQDYFYTFLKKEPVTKNIKDLIVKETLQ